MLPLWTKDMFALIGLLFVIALVVGLIWMLVQWIRDRMARLDDVERASKKALREAMEMWDQVNKLCESKPDSVGWLNA